MTTEDSSPDRPPPNGEADPALEGKTSGAGAGTDESVVTPTPSSPDTPADSVPSDSVPSDSVPSDSVPSDSVPSDSVPSDSASGDTASGDTAPIVGEHEPAILESPTPSLNENADEASAPSETALPNAALSSTALSKTALPTSATQTERTSLTDEHDVSGAVSGDGSSDAAGISEELPDEPDSERQPTALRWDYRRGAHQAAVELKRIEAEVRQLLDNCDTKRKRKLGGTHRWQELEDDVMGWRYKGRIDEGTLDRLHELIAKRHHLFRQLRFLSGTRATWNS